MNCVVCDWTKGSDTVKVSRVDGDNSSDRFSLLIVRSNPNEERPFQMEVHFPISLTDGALLDAINEKCLNTLIEHFPQFKYVQFQVTTITRTINHVTVSKTMGFLLAFFMAFNVTAANTEIIDGIEWTIEMDSYAYTLDSAREVQDGTSWLRPIGRTTSASGIKPVNLSVISGSVTIPQSVNGVRVTRICCNAFKDCVGLTEVIIPEGIDEIGGNAFYNCTNLVNVDLGKIKYISTQAFAGTGLRKVVLPKTLERVEKTSFAYAGTWNSVNGYSPCRGFLTDVALCGTQIMSENCLGRYVANPGTESEYYPNDGTSEFVYKNGYFASATVYTSEELFDQAISYFPLYSNWGNGSYFNDLKTGWAVPTFEPHASVVSCGDSIVIKSGSTNDNVKVFYTIDGSAPTNHETENCHLYSGPIEITKRTTIKAISCIDTNCFYAEVSSKEYAFGTINMPHILSSQDEVFYASHNVITIFCDTEGVEIRYTLDGKEPTPKSRLYTGPFTIDATTTVKAKAFKEDWHDSETSTSTFTREWHTVETPVIEPNGIVFVNTSQAISFSCETEGTTIYYTTDGSNPRTNGLEYSHPFPICQSCTVRAIAVKNDWKDSAEATATFTRHESLSEAVNLYDYLMETNTSNPWTVVTDVSHDGVSCAQSGAIVHGGMTWLQTSIRKAGTVSFWWKAACEEAEEEDGETYWYDYGSFFVDGVEKAKIAGNDTGWRKVEVDVPTGGKHVLRWEYRKDGATSYSPDCIWLDQVQWIPADGSGYTLTTPEPVPYSWLTGYNLGLDSDFETAAKQATGKVDAKGRAMAVWQDYVAGTDPTNQNDLLRAVIAMSNDVPIVTWSPNLNTNGEVRVYTVLGKTNLTDATWECPTNAAHRFFKVKVEMP